MSECKEILKKKTTIPLIFVSIYSFFLVFCWITLLFDANWFWNDVQTHPLISALAKLNLMSFSPNIGGHYAHLHGFIWLCGLLILPLAYSAAVGFLIKINPPKSYIITRLDMVYVPIILLAVSVQTTGAFLIALERFAYVFFVPQG